MSASDVIYIPNPRVDFAERDKETTVALVSLENSFITNSKYLQYVNMLPAKEKKHVKDLALFQHNGKKPRIFTSIYSGLITIPVGRVDVFKYKHIHKHPVSNNLMISNV